MLLLMMKNLILSSVVLLFVIFTISLLMSPPLGYVMIKIGDDKDKSEILKVNDTGWFF